MASCSGRLSFTVPKAKKLRREDPFDNLPHFNWQDLQGIRRIGNGSFGTVDFAVYRGLDGLSKEVVVKQPLGIEGYGYEFAKEAKLLAELKGHPNVAEFIPVSCAPNFALMQEYVSFSAFGSDKLVNSLADFLATVHSLFDYEGFEHVQIVAAKDIIKSIEFVHGKDIVYRDLKL